MCIFHRRLMEGITSCRSGNHSQRARQEWEIILSLMSIAFYNFMLLTVNPCCFSFACVELSTHSNFSFNIIYLSIFSPYIFYLAIQEYMELNSKPQMKSEKEPVRMFFLQKVFWDKRLEMVQGFPFSFPDRGIYQLIGNR